MYTSLLMVTVLYLTITCPAGLAHGQNEAVTPLCPENQFWTEIGCLDRPKLLSRTDPKYPRKARRRGLQGTVTLAVILNADGTIGEIQIEGSNARGVGFEESAIKAVKKWRYLPVIHQGKPVPICFTVKVNFELIRKEP